ncbi:MAG: nucleotide exchange factor GrpE [Candidatus Limnocylindrales bacterium]
MTSHRTRAQERIDALQAPSAAKLLTRVEELEAELAAARREAADNLSGWQREAADFRNYKRRTEQDREAILGLASESLLRKVLALADDFDRAIDLMPPELGKVPWTEGIVAIDRKLRMLLDSEGVTPIEVLGKPFDPREHEAITHETTDEVPDETVIGEIQRGYRIRERVLRPALVAVSKHPGEDAGSGGND